MQPQRQKPRAVIYVDGFNFYYGCFKNPQRASWKPFRWLDLGQFCNKVFPGYQIEQIRYFTALVKPTPDDPDQPIRQLTYLRALQTLSHLTIHEGRFARSAKWRYEADPASFSPPYRPTFAHPLKKVCIIEEEEKGSDVNLASYLIVDGFQNRYDVAVVVSNDSDLAEPIRLVKTTIGKRVMILNPRSRTATDLQGIADGYRTVRLGPIASSQFPKTLQDEHGVISKPATW